MCRCTPEIRTPFCGKGDCVWPGGEYKSSLPGLKPILEMLGMSQKSLAEKSGLTEAAISQIINGERDPMLSSVLAILKVIPVSFEKLIKDPQEKGGAE